MFEKGDYQIDRKWTVAHFRKFYNKIWVVFFQEKAFCRFYFQAKRTSIGSFKNGTRDFQKSPLFERPTCFYVVMTENFERFQYFNFETSFQKNKNLGLRKNWSTDFLLNVLRLKTQHFHTNLPCQKPMLRQINEEYKTVFSKRTDFSQ